MSQNVNVHALCPSELEISRALKLELLVTWPPNAIKCEIVQLYLCHHNRAYVICFLRFLFH